MIISSKKTNIKILSLLFVLLVFSGTIGYMVIEGYNVINALFMTIITISTVGYGTIRELSDLGIFFTILLIMSSFLIVGLVVQNFYRYISEGEFKKSLRNSKIKRKMKNMENHVIVCGYGLNGSHATQELINAHEKVVVIDENQKIIENAESHNVNAIFILGDARDEEILEDAGIYQAKAIIIALHVDADNLFVVLTARDLNPKLKIISRAVEDSSERKLRRAGADYVILPDSVGGIKMAKLVSEPDVLEFLEQIMAKSGISVNLAEIGCNELPEINIGKSLGDLNIRKHSGANVIGMKLEDGTYIFNPGANIKIERKSKLFILGTPDQVDLFKKMIESI
ncbi:MAG: potassium channel protein [Bacteroidales bacterium]|nr:potassium channel protein [Bacteroidales bacterium]